MRGTAGIRAMGVRGGTNRVLRTRAEGGGHPGAGEQCVCVARDAYKTVCAQVVQKWGSLS